MIFIIVIVVTIGFSHEQPPDSPVAIIAQNLNSDTEIPTGNGTAIGTLEKYHNASEPSFLYIVQIELKSSRVEESFTEIGKRLNKLVEMAFVLAAYKHRKQAPPAEITTSNSGYNTKVIKKRTSADATFISFVTYSGSELILGEVVADDLALLSVSQLSAVLRYPVGKIISDRDIEAESAAKWLWLVGIIGAGVLLIIVGWCCLFIFYNFCGYMCGTDDRKYNYRAPKIKTIKLPADQPDFALPFDDSNLSVTAKKPKLNKKTQRSSRILSEIHVELEDERRNIQKAVDAYKKAVDEKIRGILDPLPFPFVPKAVDTENSDVKTAPRTVVAKSEKRRRHTKIGPITAVTTTTTRGDEQERKTSEISRVSSVTTTSADELDDFDVSNLPETTLKISKKKKKEEEPEVKSEPESDYGSSLDDEKSKDEILKEKKIHEEVVRARPMTAKTQRTSLFGGTLLSAIPVQPHAWTVYQAGDKVAEFWNNKEIHNHPYPASPTENGIIELNSRNFYYK